jgi:hypothetical protein
VPQVSLLRPGILLVKANLVQPKMMKCTGFTGCGKTHPSEGYGPKPAFLTIKKRIWVRGFRRGLGKAVFSWHNCVIET